MCDHTYLYHIIKYYNDLKDENIFLTGSSYNIKRKKLSLEIILKNYKKYSYLPFFYGKNIPYYNNENFKMNTTYYCPKKNKIDNCLLKKYKFKNYDEFYDAHLKQYGLKDRVSFGGVFSVHKKIF